MERSTRAWLSLVVVQAMGSVWMCYAKQNSGQHYLKSTPTLARSHALPLALLCILRIVLIFDYKSFTIHLTHIILSMVAALHTLSEVFLFNSMSYGVVTVTEVTLNGFTAFVMVMYLLSPAFSDSQDELTKKRRARKVTAKHYMEGDMLTPDDDDELVQAYNKQK